MECIPVLYCTFGDKKGAAGLHSTDIFFFKTTKCIPTAKHFKAFYIEDLEGKAPFTLNVFSL